MKSFLFTWAFLCCLVLSGMAQNQKEDVFFEGQYIRGIEVGSAFSVTVTQGNSTRVKVSVPERFEKNLVVSLSEDGEVKVCLNGKVNARKEDRFVVEMVCSVLEKVHLSGACQMIGKGNFNSKRLEVEVNGASRMKMEGRIQVEQGTEIEVSGAARMEADLATRLLEIEVSGASRLILKGMAQVGELEANGASHVGLEGFSIDRLSLEASGASVVSGMEVKEEFNVEANGASKVTYRGNPRVTPDISGASSLKKN